MHMHDYVLIDVIEEYKAVENFNVEFVGHVFIIACYSCNKVRTIREDTFNKMNKLGLIEVVESL